MSDLLEGTWIPFKAELAGEAAPPEVLARTRVVLRGGSYAMHFGGDVADEGSYELAATGGLLVITLKSVRGIHAGRIVPALYQISGDRLRVCYGLRGVLPADFTSTAENQMYVVTYRRNF